MDIVLILIATILNLIVIGTASSKIGYKYGIIIEKLSNLESKKTDFTSCPNFSEHKKNEN